MTLRRGDAPLRLRQARPARQARADRADRRDEATSTSRCSRRRRPAKDGRVAALRVPGRRRDDAAARSTATPSSSRSTAPRAWPGSRSTTSPRDARACSRRSSRTCTTRRSPRSSSAPARKNGDLIFFGADKAKVVNDALGALRAKIGHSEFGRRAGCRRTSGQPLWVVDFPMFEYDEEAQRWTSLRIIRSPRPKDGHEDLLETDPAQAHRQGLRHGAERLGDRRRLGAHPPRGSAEQGVPRARTSARKKRTPSSASCSTRCSTARRRTAASRSASTASSR